MQAGWHPPDNVVALESEEGQAHKTAPLSAAARGPEARRMILGVLLLVIGLAGGYMLRGFVSKQRRNYGLKRAVENEIERAGA